MGKEDAQWCQLCVSGSQRATRVPPGQSQHLGQRGRDSAVTVNICLVQMVRSRASHLGLLADKRKVEPSHSVCWRTVLLGMCNVGDSGGAT